MADLRALAFAWQERDKKALARAGFVVGLPLDQLAMLRLQLIQEYDVLETIEQAVASAAGLALCEVKQPFPGFGRAKEFCLAVVRDGHVVVGTSIAPKSPDSPGRVWPELAPWSKEVARNAERAQVWAAVPRRARFPLTAPRAAMAPSVARRAPDEAALLQQLVADPADRAPVLVLADLLIERGDAGGEILQLVERRRTQKLRPAEARRLEALVDEHSKRLAADVEQHASAIEIVDGLVDQVTMTAGAFRKHGERLFASQPIRELRIKPYDAAAIKALAASPHLTLVRSLVFANAGLAHEKPVALAPLHGVRLPLLDELALEHCLTLGPDGEGFFANLDAPRLRTLRVQTGMFGGKPLAGLFGNPRLGSLEELVMYMLPRRGRSGERIEAGADALADAAFASIRSLPALRRLQLDDAWFIDDERIAALVRRAPAVEDIAVAPIGEETGKALAACPALRAAHLPATLTAPTLARLLALPRLEHLLFDSDGTPAELARTAEALLAVPRKHRLRVVSLPGPHYQQLKQRFPAGE